MVSFIKNYSKYILLLAIIYMPLFGHLESLAVRIWDESRLAQTAFEMLQNGNYLVTYVDGIPDMISVKPPLMIWAQVFFMKIIGVNELAVRLPSALAALITCLALILFLKKRTGKAWLGIFSVLILISSSGYVALHASRTGDYDVPMTLFTTIAAFCYFVFLEKGRSKYLYYFFIAITIAVLIKSVNALLFAPALLIYTLIDKKLFVVLKSRAFYFGLSCSVLVILGYYVSREYYNPGYLSKVNEYELGGRFLSTLDQHNHPFSYYLKNLWNYQYTFWLLFLPFGAFLGLRSSSPSYKKFTLLVILLILTYFLVISSAQTKLAWYVTPLFPLMAILNANVLYFVYDKLISIIKRPALKFISPLLVTILFISWPYQKVFSDNYCPKETAIDLNKHSMSYFLKNAIKNKKDLKDYKIIYEGYRTHITFYVSILNTKGMNIQYATREDIMMGDRILIHSEQVKQHIRENYEFNLLETFLDIQSVEIIRRSNSNKSAKPISDQSGS